MAISRDVRSRGVQKPGFLPKSGVRMPELSQKPGFLDGWAIAWGSETGFLTKIGREDARIIAETRFLGWLGDRAGSQKPGFFTKSGVRCQNYRRNPVSWIWVERRFVSILQMLNAGLIDR
ncbi:hypothetical protein NDI47_26585 [Microcoleus vaginatus GB1-A2]|uniref:hypothetical protein n=1 Tax=Microcoleus vaginatus TaxID=119532 RepID=UPI00168213E9|nr:hypothetical protein [Microcoleus sp. FACHB-61]